MNSWSVAVDLHCQRRTGICGGDLGSKPAALELDLPGSIPGRGPIFRVALALSLFKKYHVRYYNFLILISCCDIILIQWNPFNWATSGLSFLPQLSGCRNKEDRVYVICNYSEKDVLWMNKRQGKICPIDTTGRVSSYLGSHQQ